MRKYREVESVEIPEIDIILKKRRVRLRKKMFWGIVHNLVCHPLLALADILRIVKIETTVFDRFHDWTANKM